MCQAFQRLRKIITVEPVVFFYMTGAFLLLPAVQQLILAKVCQELYNEDICSQIGNHVEENQVIQSKSSYILLAFSAVMSLVSIPPSLLLGSWSDREGRKLGMILPSICSMVTGGILITVTKVQQLNVYWTILTAFTIGVSGGHVAIFLSAFSYLSDVSDTDRLTLRIAIAESMVFVGGTAGFLLSGILIEHFSFTHVFATYCFCHFLSVFYVLLWLQNPTSVDRRINILNEVQHQERIIQKLSICTYVKMSFGSVLKKRRLQDRLKLHLLILCTFLLNVCSIGEQNVTLLFLMYPPRNFSSLLYGGFTSAKMLLSGFCLFGLFPILLHFVGEMTLAKVGTIMRAASLILMAFSSNTWMVFLAAGIGAVSGFTQAVVRSVSSRVVEPSEQGAMFSIMASVEATCIIIAAGIFNTLYPVTLTNIPGMSFLVMAAFIIITFILVQWISEMPVTQQPLLIVEE
ncbi:solute carrier family 46 member 3 isoform X2 [Erpetoichthys calabaricus]|nr:solute carrier family 46 member 3 isoform X2 [Erpetoichthys calabaricus]